MVETGGIHERTLALHADTVATRRDIHANPEIAFEEERTSGLVAERLRELGMPVTAGVAKTGVVGLLRCARPGPTLLIRADMDALPIQEQNDAAYRSKTAGKMHACGHDAHTAMLLTVARILSDLREDLPGTIKFAFQPAEEDQGGARPMIDEGTLESPHVDAALGLHVSSSLATGQIAAVAGPRNANSDRFTLTIRGKGGHGARPHRAVDPIVVGFHVGTALQTLVSRETNPLRSAVVTIGAVHAGTVANVIPMDMTMLGTVRTYDPELREHLRRRIGELAEGICAAMRADVDYLWRDGYPALVNDADMSQLVREAAAEVVDPSQIVTTEPSMGGEDMAFFLERVPGCFFNVGTGNAFIGTDFPHHHPRFDVDEAGLVTGVEVMVRAAIKYLSRGEV